MQLSTFRSDRIYRKIASSPEDEREDIYRYELMKPFEYKYSLVGIPLKAEIAGGYDVVMAALMSGGYEPRKITNELLPVIDQLSVDDLWNACEESIRKTIEEFLSHGVELKVQDYLFTLLLNDPANPMTAFTGDCCGDGGIPGYILGTIVPKETTIKQMPVVLAHETNHNIRWQYCQWSNQITLADLIVSEGLAECYESVRFGEEMLGPWATALSKEEVLTTVNPLLYPHLSETNFQIISSYLYGDGIMSLRGAPSLGIPDYAGYTCGYYLIQHYLKKTGASIYEATITSTKEILDATTDFWN